MHVNYHRGETRELAWRKRPNHVLRHYGQNWRRACVEFKHRKATCELEEPRHKRAKKERGKPYVLQTHTGCWHRRYATKESARQAIKQLNKGWWAGIYLWVEKVA